MIFQQYDLCINFLFYSCRQKLSKEKWCNSSASSINTFRKRKTKTNQRKQTNSKKRYDKADRKIILNAYLQNIKCKVSRSDRRFFGYTLKFTLLRVNVADVPVPFTLFVLCVLISYKLLCLHSKMNRWRISEREKKKKICTASVKTYDFYIRTKAWEGGTPTYF